MSEHYGVIGVGNNVFQLEMNDKTLQSQIDIVH